MRKQRAIAKCCVDSIQKTDGFRYSFHNCWNSREDDSYRFSYYCNDSLLNKDRAANGKGAKLGKRATKPVYDCKGVLAVKFSATKQSLEVIYKHVPIHKTYEERAPPPRKDSKRRKILEETDPEALIRIASRPKPPKPPEGELDADAPPKPKRKRTKRTDDPQKQTAANSIESDLRAQSLRSLLELIQTDSTAEPVEEPAEKENEEAAAAQAQAQAQPRRRPRNSCDVCKNKKTKCDGTRPICNTCRDKNRQCFYSDGSVDITNQPKPSVPQPARQAEPERPPPPSQADIERETEVEKLRKELEAAKSQIAALQAEKETVAKSVTPPQRSQPPPQRPQPPPIQTSQSQQQIQTPQYAQFNQIPTLPAYGVTRPNPSPKPPPQSRSSMNRQMQSQNSNHPRQSQSSSHQVQTQNSSHQLQTPNSAHQLQTPNSAHQMQTPNSNHQMQVASSNHPIPTASSNHQLQTPNSALNPTQDATEVYGRDYRWQPHLYYQTPTSMHQPSLQGQPEPWGSTRGSGGYR